MAFLDTPRFPDDISYGSKGGPMYKTSLLTMVSGREKRNISWSQARHSYDVAYGIKNQTQLDTLLTYFHSMRGRAHSFRFKDFADFHTATPSGYGSAGAPAVAVTKDDQVFGTGDGAETAFQLIKTYTTGALSSARDITKPIVGTVLVAVDGILQTEGGGNDYTLDYTTGIVTFNSPPANTLSITWGGQFDVPCRFDVDMLETVIDSYQIGNVNVPIIEIRV